MRLAVFGVLVLELCIVLNGREAGGGEDFLGLVRLGTERCGLLRVPLFLRLVGRDLSLDFIAKCRRLELDIVLREAAQQLRPIRRAASQLPRSAPCCASASSA